VETASLHRTGSSDEERKVQQHLGVLQWHHALQTGGNWFNPQVRKTQLDGGCRIAFKTVSLKGT